MINIIVYGISGIIFLGCAFTGKDTNALILANIYFIGTYLLWKILEVERKVDSNAKS